MAQNRETAIPKFLRVLICVAVVLIITVVTLALNLTTEGFSNPKILIALGVIVSAVLISASFLLIAFKSTKNS